MTISVGRRTIQAVQNFQKNEINKAKVNLRENPNAETPDDVRVKQAKQKWDRGKQKMSKVDREYEEAKRRYRQKYEGTGFLRVAVALSGGSEQYELEEQKEALALAKQTVKEAKDAYFRAMKWAALQKESFLTKIFNPMFWATEHIVIASMLVLLPILLVSYWLCGRRQASAATVLPL